MKDQEQLNKQIEKAMSFDTSVIEVDVPSIRKAVDEGVNISKQKQRIKENIIFIALATALFVISGLVVTMGYGIAVLIVEIIIAGIVPLTIPFILRQQIRGGA